MRFKIDENLPVEFADELRAIGHDAITVREQRMGGAPDEDLFAVCIDEDRILMTMDIDFADIRVYPRVSVAGNSCVQDPASGQKSASLLSWTDYPVTGKRADSSHALDSGRR